MFTVAYVSAAITVSSRAFAGMRILKSVKLWAAIATQEERPPATMHFTNTLCLRRHDDQNQPILYVSRELIDSDRHHEVVKIY